MTIKEIHERSRQHNYPDQGYTDKNREHVLDLLRDAAQYEGDYGGLVDAIAAEPYYQSPSVYARRVSAGQVAYRLRTEHAAISAGEGISKQAISSLVTEWKSEMEGYENAVTAGKIAPFMGEALRFALWREAL